MATCAAAMAARQDAAGSGGTTSRSPPDSSPAAARSPLSAADRASQPRARSARELVPAAVSW